MPTSSEILAGLTRIANEGIAFALLWHFLAGLALAWLGLGHQRPTRRVAAVALALPVATASLFAWRGGNPFNGTVLALAVVALVTLGLRLPATPVSPGPRWAVILGAVAVAYGLLYPHFLAGKPAWMYLVAAPTGLVPCPTLAVVIGAALIAGGFDSRPWSLVATGLGLLYSAFGAFRLHVWLDLGLAVFSVGLLALSLGRHALSSRVEAPA